MNFYLVRAYIQRPWIRCSWATSSESHLTFNTASNVNPTGLCAICQTKKAKVGGGGSTQLRVSMFIGSFTRTASDVDKTTQVNSNEEMRLPHAE